MNNLHNEIFILGNGGFAKDVAFLISRLDEWKIIGCLEERQEQRLLYVSKPTYVALGTGQPDINKKIVTRLKANPNIIFPTLIDKSVIYNKNSVSFGEGNIVCAGNIITANIEIGSYNIINHATTIGHDSTIHDFCVVSPGANVSGNVTIESMCYLGTNCTVIENIKIGEGSIIGAGSVVVKDVSPNTMNYGVPSRERRSL